MLNLLLLHILIFSAIYNYEIELKIFHLKHN